MVRISSSSSSRHRKQPSSSSSSSSAVFAANQLVAAKASTREASVSHPHHQDTGAASSSSSALRELYRVQPEDPAKPDLRALKEVASVYWGTSLVVDLDSIALPDLDQLLELLKAFARRAKRARSPMAQLFLTNITLLDSLDRIRLIVDAVGEALSSEEGASVCEVLFLSIQCSPEETVELESLCLSMANEVILPAPGGPRAISRLTPEERLDASRIKSELGIKEHKPAAADGDTGKALLPAELPSAQETPTGDASWMDDMALVECDHCHRRRFVSTATAEWVAHLDEFFCSMLEGSHCTAIDDWPLIPSPSTAPSQTAVAPKSPLKITGLKRQRSKSRDAQHDLQVDGAPSSAPSVANKKRKATAKVAVHADDSEGRDEDGDAEDTRKVIKEAISRIEKEKLPPRRNRVSSLYRCRVEAIAAEVFGGRNPSLVLVPARPYYPAHSYGAAARPGRTTGGQPRSYGHPGLVLRGGSGGNGLARVAQKERHQRPQIHKIPCW
ncbi:hypothetical protein FOZ60_006653 [Perkinsus olseni]|uniref:Uncharacterized protein n=1 Tax=Perkinsus olseni TaxID=32597 RepID=A0A7J6NN73_PEROL|nr:hypothetical protein FOZ60_006653 [Perkinsus olseni]